MVMHFDSAFQGASVNEYVICPYVSFVIKTDNLGHIVRNYVQLGIRTL